MQGAWVVEGGPAGRDYVCIFGEDLEVPSADERRAIDAGCEWDHMYCTTTDSRDGGTYVCPAGTAERLGIQAAPGPGQLAQRPISETVQNIISGGGGPTRIWPWFVGGAAVLAAGGVALWLLLRKPEPRVVMT